METDQYIWRDWARFLHRWGVEDWVAAFLEAAGPITVLGSQMIYLSQPFMGKLSFSPQLDAMAKVLEDEQITRTFAKFLREADVK